MDNKIKRFKQTVHMKQILKKQFNLSSIKVRSHLIGFGKYKYYLFWVNGPSVYDVRAFIQKRFPSCDLYECYRYE